MGTKSDAAATNGVARVPATPDIDPLPVVTPTPESLGPVKEVSSEFTLTPGHGVAAPPSIKLNRIVAISPSANWPTGHTPNWQETAISGCLLALKVTVEAAAAFPPLQGALKGIRELIDQHQVCIV